MVLCLRDAIRGNLPADPSFSDATNSITVEAQRIIPAAFLHTIWVLANLLPKRSRFSSWKHDQPHPKGQLGIAAHNPV